MPTHGQYILARVKYCFAMLAAFYHQFQSLANTAAGLRDAFI